MLVLWEDPIEEHVKEVEAGRIGRVSTMVDVAGGVDYVVMLEADMLVQ